MKRFGQVIGVRPEHFESYKKYHAAVWPEILGMIKKCNMQNYSIYHKDGMLFAYFEYTGTDFAADMAKLNQNYSCLWTKEQVDAFISSL